MSIDVWRKWEGWGAATYMCKRKKKQAHRGATMMCPVALCSVLECAEGAHLLDSAARAPGQWTVPEHRVTGPWAGIL